MLYKVSLSFGEKLHGYARCSCVLVPLCCKTSKRVSPAVILIGKDWTCQNMNSLGFFCEPQIFQHGQSCIVGLGVKAMVKGLYFGKTDWLAQSQISKKLVVFKSIWDYASHHHYREIISMERRVSFRTLEVILSKKKKKTVPAKTTFLKIGLFLCLKLHD